MNSSLAKHLNPPTTTANYMALTSQFEITAQIEQVWDELTQPEHWPQWWHYVKSVELVVAGDERDIGTVRTIRWATALPYTLDLTVHTLRIEKPHTIEVTAQGDLRGKGVWQLESTLSGTRIRYSWSIALEKAWMRRLAPLLKPLFAWNHHRVMQVGAQGLAQRLNASLLSYERVATITLVKTTQ